MLSLVNTGRLGGAPDSLKSKGTNCVQMVTIIHKTRDKCGFYFITVYWQLCQCDCSVLHTCSAQTWQDNFFKKLNKILLNIVDSWRKKVKRVETIISVLESNIKGGEKETLWKSGGGVGNVSIVTRIPSSSPRQILEPYIPTSNIEFNACPRSWSWG